MSKKMLFMLCYALHQSLICVPGHHHGRTCVSALFNHIVLRCTHHKSGSDPGKTIRITFVNLSHAQCNQWLICYLRFKSFLVRSGHWDLMDASNAFNQ